MAARIDIVSDLYVTELKSYKAPPAEKINLPTTFAQPASPAVPEVEKAPVVAASGGEVVESEDGEWPALVDMIDDPELYNDEYDVDDEREDGAL